MSDRLKYLIMRCVSCKDFVTKAQIIDTWEEWERTGAREKGLCPCGSRQLKLGNLTDEERKKYESTWQWFRYRVLGKRDHGTRVWELYYRFVKDQSLGDIYTGS